MKALILAGGKGTRLQSVLRDLPKPMAPIGNKPFLEYLVLQLKQWGITDIIFSIGYKGEIIKSYFNDSGKWGVTIEYSEEDVPLGTGGAVKKAENIIGSDSFLVLNGDSFCPVNLAELMDFHIQKKALVSVVMVESTNTADYGRITLDDRSRIVRFEEKAGPKGESYISAGIYMFEKRVLSMIPPDLHYSLEYDLFPDLVSKDFFGFVAEQELVDIGTPERYERADRLLGK